MVSHSTTIALILQSDTLSPSHTLMYTLTPFPLPLQCTYVYTIHVLERIRPTLNNDIKTSRLIRRRKGKGSLHPLFYFFNFNGYRKLWVNYMPFYFCSKGFCSLLNQRNTTSIYRAKLHIEHWANYILNIINVDQIFKKKPTPIPGLKKTMTLTADPIHVNRHCIA